MTYAFVDSRTRGMMVSSNAPNHVSMWWEVSDDADPNALVVVPVYPFDEDGVPDPEAEPEIMCVEVAEPAPHPWMIWDFDAQVWRDARSPERLAEARVAARRAASMSRSAFCVACAQAGILTEDEAIAAAKGEIPLGLLPVFEGMPDDVRLKNRVRWAGSQVILRNDPIILACGEYLGLSEVEIDALFGL